MGIVARSVRNLGMQAVYGVQEYVVMWGLGLSGMWDLGDMWDVADVWVCVIWIAGGLGVIGSG